MNPHTAQQKLLFIHNTAKLSVLKQPFHHERSDAWPQTVEYNVTNCHHVRAPSSRSSVSDSVWDASCHSNNATLVITQ
ncbi:hypothetical protein VZT92_022700 [Zoarces viviparus]|uniref:Uncharacterized protein n=1 Tax=Zoarces viviparus TaxID=48416 RepID=A0AAW1ECR8_ZOAVI